MYAWCCPRGLRWSLFLFILVFCSASVISTTLSSRLLIYSSVSFSLLLIPYIVIFILFIIFFIFVWLLFIFSSSLLKTFVISYSVHLFSSRVLSSSSWSLPWTRFWVDCLYLPHLVLGFYPIPSFETCSSVTSFAQVPVFMYLVCWLCFWTVENYPFVGDILCVPAADFSLVTRALCSRGASCVCFLSPSVVVGWPLWVVWQVLLAPGLTGCQALPCAEAAGHRLVGLDPEIACCGTPGALGHVLAH